jgi:broad specificity phosphatase PhoE
VSRIYVARHGESTWNAEHRWTGHGDPPLTEAGRAQAREACVSLGPHRFDAVVSSTLARAVESAAIIGASLGLRRLEVVPNSKVTYAPGASPDTRNYRVDFSKIERLVPGFRPSWTVKQGVEERRRGSWTGICARRGRVSLQATA